MNFRRSFLAWIITASTLAVPESRVLLTQNNPTRNHDAVEALEIRGVLKLADARQGVPRAVVTLAGGPRIQQTTTNADGSFVFRGLAPQEYFVSAQKVGYLGSAYGVHYLGQPPMAVMASAANAQPIELLMWRGGAIQGRVSDRRGYPLPGVSVFALRDEVPTVIGLVSAEPMVTTDSRGEYRFLALTPGRYVVVGATNLGTDQATEVMSREDIDRILQRLRVEERAEPPDISSAGGVSDRKMLTWPAIYYPGVPAFQEARRLDLGPGQDLTGIDFAIAPTPSSSIEGVLSGLLPDEMGQVQLSITPDGPPVLGLGTLPNLDKGPMSDGRFKYSQVAPGRYFISAVVSGLNGSARDNTAVVTGSNSGYANAEVIVAPGQTAQAYLSVSKGATVTGRVLTESTNGPDPVVSSIIVRLKSDRPSFSWKSSSGTEIGNSNRSVPPTRLLRDGTFAFRNVPPGSYQFSCDLPESTRRTWWVRSAVADGKDLLDGQLIVEDGNTAIVVTLTAARSEVFGTLQAPLDVDLTYHFVVAFPADRSLWHPESRRIRAVRVARDRRFAISDLPAGKYFLASVDDLNPSSLTELPFLEALSSLAAPIEITDGSRLERNLIVR